MTELTPFQNLMGGVPSRAMTALFGSPEAGKTTLGMQLTCEAAVLQNGNACVLDTELNEHAFSDLAEKFSNRWDEDINVVFVQPDVRKKSGKDGKDGKDRYDVKWMYEDEVPKSGFTLFVIQCPDIEKITHLYGQGVEINITEGGKVDAEHVTGSWINDIRETPLGQFVEKHNIRAFLIDSATNPMDKIIAKTKNFPGRSDVTQIWLVRHMELCWGTHPVFSKEDKNEILRYDGLASFVVLHESKNEAGAFSKELKMEGGKGVRYNVKHVLYLLDRNERGLIPGEAPKPNKLAETGRTLYAVRVPGKKSWSSFVEIDYTDTGFIAYK